MSNPMDANTKRTLEKPRQHQAKRLKTIESFFKRQPAPATPRPSVPVEPGPETTPLFHAPAAGASASTATSVINAQEGIESCSVNSLPESSSTNPDSVIVTNDIGNFIGKNISDFQKRELLLNPWKPPANYDFPFSTYKCKGKEYRRYLNQKHLDHYKNWVVLSHSSRGLFCKYCPWFNVGNVGGKDTNVRLKKLVTEPLITFKDLLGSSQNSVLANHEQNQYHKTAVEKAKNFLETYDKPEVDVINQMNKGRLAQVQENRERLVPIIRATLFLGRQGLAFRGHRDDGRLTTTGSSITENEGNFREILRLMVASGDKKLEEHLKSSSSNATYISKTIQNQIIECIGEEIAEKILTRIRGALFYSILFDETTDLAHKSQLSLVIRYVSQNEVHEDFVSFVDTFEDYDRANNNESDVEEEETQGRQEVKMTGEVVGQIVLRLLKKFSLPLNLCVGIGTDGCSMMISEVRGAVSEIQKEAKNALRTPCYNHKLNLTLSQSNKVSSLRNAIGTMKECVSFFDASAKRCRVLRKHLGHNLSGLCETRWTERHDGVLQFSEDLPKVLEALEVIATWDDLSTSSKASQLKAAVTDGSFVISVLCLSDILALSLPLSKLFQKPDLDLDAAAEMICSLKTVLSTRRENSEEYFNKIWAKAEELAQEVDAHLKPPRRCGRQKNRANYETEDANSYFRQAVYVPLLDNIIMDLTERFSSEVLDCFQLPLFFPSNVTKIATSAVLEQKAEILVKKFQNLLPHHVSLSQKLLVGELHMWREKWLGCSGAYPQTAADILKNCDAEIYPYINLFLNLLISLPISTASAERSFSVLRRLKSWLRTTMSESRLTGLALMLVHRREELNIDRIIDRFSKSGNRRINFMV